MGKKERRHKSWKAVFIVTAYQDGFATVCRGKSEKTFPVNDLLAEEIAGFVYDNLRKQLQIYGVASDEKVEIPSKGWNYVSLKDEGIVVGWKKDIPFEKVEKVLKKIKTELILGIRDLVKKKN